ncbi:hypothetical protein AVEN_215452-1 [Araneus ventricosus]|uniref:Integrase catalytic domain-containing protein n=1 Tax=Araneus ventricosus TaxID=182803 RepID=A0A4Y2JRT8_ARAVE|nr:hypothetical protein AVEN_215452-1 [Araneus ventricosus]
MLSRPICTHKKPKCEICTITIDVPARYSKDIRNEQMKDDKLKKIIDNFESPGKGTDYSNWTERGYLMNHGVLYSYSPDSDSEEAQLVIPTQEREQILRDHHDAPKAGHYGAEGTFNRTNITGLRFETLAIDLFGPLPESKDGKKWIFIVEDYTTKWVELFALPSATAKECATTLLEEVRLRYGIPRRIISDNEKLPSIRFALNTAKCQTTGQTAAFLHFGRELRTADDVTHDLRVVIENDNFVAEITPYLKKFSQFMAQAKEVVEQQQDKRKQYADKRRRDTPQFHTGDKVYVISHPVSSADKGKTSKFLPLRDGPDLIVSKRSPTTYEIANLENPRTPIVVYHTSALKEFWQDRSNAPILPLRKRGRPRKSVTAGSWSGRLWNQRGRL